MSAGGLGKIYNDGEVIVRQGDVGDCMYVVQSGAVEVVMQRDGKEVPLRRLAKGDVFGEMSLFDREVRSATVRARGEARLLTVDKVTFFSRVHEDPTLAFHIVKTMARRIRELSDEIARLQSPK
jgi:CRP/FNR family transcriptional regulator, cyclic AMP receptor protein